MDAMTRSGSNSQPLWLDLLTLFLVGLLIRIAFVHLHPAIYGGDTLARIMNADRIVLAYQLPLLQLLIHLVNRASRDPLLIRYLMSLIGALAGAAFYLFSVTLLGRRKARLASVFFVFNPFLLVHSIVPYQEILMLLLLCLGLYSLFDGDPCTSLPWSRSIPGAVKTNLLPDRRQIACASLFLGLACLTRYEAWVITATAAVHYARQRLVSNLSPVRAIAQAIVLFGWAPLLWIVLHRGVSPQGTYVLEGVIHWTRFWRIPYVAGMTLYHAGPITGLLAILGLLAFWRTSLWRKAEVQIVLASAGVLMLSLVFSAHGVAPDPERYVTDREAHWFILFTFWGASLALSKIRQRSMPSHPSSQPQPSTVFPILRESIYYLALALAVLWGTFQTDRYLKRLISDQNLILDYAVAQHLQRNLPDGSKALVFAEPLPLDATLEYFAKVQAQGGTQALEAARRKLEDIQFGPPDYSRVVVNTRLGKSQILDSSKLRVSGSDAETFLSENRVRLAAVFSNHGNDATNTRPLLDYVLQRGKHQATFKDRGLQVSIYELQP